MADNNPMTALVEYQIRAENTSTAAWLDEWAVRAADAFDGEPETAAYAAAINVEAPDQVLVYERYDAGDTSLATHVARPAHKHLIDTMGERNMTRRRVFSVIADDLPGYGWWVRPDPGPGNAEGQILVVIGMRFQTPAMRDAFIEISSAHAGWCLANEPDTTIYSGGLAREDSDRLDIKQGDLVFVMGCTDMAAVTRHMEKPRHVALGGQLEAAGVALNNTFMCTYRSAGCGYLWRDSTA